MKIKDDIYRLLNDYIDDNDKIRQIYNKINELETTIKNDYKNEVKILKKQIIDFENKLDYEEKQNKLLENIINDFYIFRCALNKIVYESWFIYEHKIIDLDYEDSINSYAFKYANARINNKCEGLSVELCKLYLLLNYSYIPIIKPLVIEESITNIQTQIKKSIPGHHLSIFFNSEIINGDSYIIIKPLSVIKTAISNIKELLNNNLVPDYYLAIGLNHEIIYEIEYIIKNNPKLLS